MPFTVHVTVRNPDELLRDGQYGAGALIRFQSSATELGAYADLTGTGADATLPIQADLTEYDADDPSGTSTTWYRVRYENAANTRASDWTAVFQPGADTWIDGPQLLAYMNGKVGTDDDWAADCAAATNAAIDRVLEVDPPRTAAMVAEVTSAALIIGAALWKRREAPNGLVPVTDLAGVAMRMAKDPVDGVRPMLNRWHPTAGIGIG